MEVTILNEQQRDLLSRKDVVARVHHEGATPTRFTITEALAKKLNAKMDTVVVRGVYTEFGNSVSKVEASVYKDAATLAKGEPTYIKKRIEKAQPPAPEPKEEAPAEETADEPAEETKEADA